MTTYIIDGSSWSADKAENQEIYTLKINVQQLIDTGCVGVITRFSSGSWVDPVAEQFLVQLDGKITFGAYYYDRHSVAAEICAETFCRQVLKLGGLDALALGVWCDAPEVESIGTAAIEHTLKSLRLVCETLQPDMKKTGIYTNKNFWRSNGGEYEKFKEEALKYQLWCALWNDLPGVVPEAYRPKPWERWVFHQYSADNNRMARHLGILSGDPDADLNLFNPLLGRFESYFGVVKPVIGDETPADESLAAQVAGLDLRLGGLEKWAAELAYKAE